MSVEVSIVIVNYNVKQLLISCLESIYRNKYSFLFETIVIDNDSSDDSVSTVKALFPQVVVVENSVNVGFPAANNQGFKICNGKYIFMLNPDTDLIDNALQKLVDYLIKNDDVSLVAPQLLNTDGSIQKSVWRFPKITYIVAESFYLNALISDKYYLEKDFSVAFEAESMSGAALLFRKKLLEQIGMLDEYLFWIEDVDFCYRIYKAGLKMVYLPEAKVKHHIGQSAKKNYNISISNQIFNKIKFYKVHHSYAETLFLKFISLIEVSIKIGVFGILSPMNITYYRKAKAYLYTFPRIFNPPAGIS